MSRIAETFDALRAQGKKALIPYITAGFPSLEATEEIAHALVANGADIIELGMPFSDPTADGPTIQRSSEAALKAGTTLEGVLALARRLHTSCPAPIVLFGYYNPLFSRGPANAAVAVAEAGVDALLVVDLPPEEAEELYRPAREHGVDRIFLVAPTTPPERLRLIAAQGSGFLYYVSVTGVTGARGSLAESLREEVERAKRLSELPVAVGFGISTPEQAGRVAAFADGVVVGSAFINLIERHAGSPELAEIVGRFAGELRRGMDAAAER